MTAGNGSPADEVLPDLAGCWIAVADQARPLRYHMVEVLSPTNAICVEADSGDALAVLLATTAVDVVITDLRTPLRTGLDVLRDRRAHGDATPFILITGAPDPELLRDIAGATFLAEPFTREELVAAVCAAIGAAHCSEPERIALPS